MVALALVVPTLEALADEAKPQQDAPTADLRGQPEPLPTPPSRKLTSPTEEQSQMLDQLLRRLRDRDPASRQIALAEVANVDESLIPAIRVRLDREAESADRARMKTLLLAIRKKARDAIEKRMRAAGDKGEVQTPDYLEMVVAHDDTSNEAWAPLVNVLALSRMCVSMKTTEAIRVLIQVYVRFDFLRIDTQLQLAKLGDYALPALIEATHHPAPKVASWASRELDALGKAIPGEAVQVEDPAVLADVLLAYGYIKDPDAARAVLSFVNSERSQVRQAARSAVVLFGDVANWQLRDFYENMLGERPPREWPWDRTARELFSGLDEMRLEEVYRHYDAGLEALNRKDYEKMLAEFDEVLLLDPDFTPHDRLVKGYLDYAEANLYQGDHEVDVALVRVTRLGDTQEERDHAQSLLLTRQAKHYSEQQFADRSLLERALELDPNNEQARDLLSELSREPVVERTSFMRLLWPSLLAATALAAVTAILLRRRGARAK
jgi:tetratricopeptide (TPR) repeat protein